MSPHATQEATGTARDRLLDTAESLFAERGFAHASVREITATASCNIAAVNYYFGSKEALYTEVFRRRLGELRERRIAKVREVVDGATPARLEDVLRAFARVFLEPFVSGPCGQRFLQLINRELTDAHLPRAMFQSELALPVRQVMREALRRTTPGIGECEADACVQSLIAQLAHVLTMWRMSGGHDVPPPDWFEEITEHIVRFSTAGIRSYDRGDPA